MKVKKSNGKTQKFNREKIEVAIMKAAEAVEQEVPKATIRRIANEVEEAVMNTGSKTIKSEEISKLVENKLMNSSYKDVARCYIEYRHLQDMKKTVNTTDKTLMELLDGTNEYWNRENSNKNAKETTTARDYVAGIALTDLALRYFLPKDVAKAHEEGIIHFHDMDYFAPGPTMRTNCCLVNLEDILQNGSVMNGVMIEKPHRFITACTIATQVVNAVSASQYGGTTISMTHLAPFARLSYERYLKKYLDWEIAENQAKEFAWRDMRKEIADGVQTLQYQVISMASGNGQAPFVSFNLDISETDEYKEELALIIEEVLKQRIQGVKNSKGTYYTVAFPKLLYVLSEENIHEDSPYWYLTELAAKCTAKRMVPDYISKKKMQEYKIDKFGKGDCYPCMGCRSFLSPDFIEGNPAKALNYDPNKAKFYGRFNCGVCTISLPDLAFSSGGDMDKFWKLFEERTELCHRALQARLEQLKTVKPENAPILWKYGALARLEDGESIEPLLYGGYSTISLGYAGLYECVKYMTGKSHTDEGEGEAFGLKVMQALNDKCNQWKEEEGAGYSLYGTPIESTTYKFAKNLKRRFGNDVFIKLDGKDRDYITNSYHAWVEEPLDPFQKLEIEAKFQKLSPGGAISYIETADMTTNISAVLEVIKFIYDTIMYAELNCASSYCHVCGGENTIEIIEDNGDLKYHCKACGNENHDLMNYSVRVCGYISTQICNKGRLDDIRSRYVHLDNHEC